tara:strand:+ start:3792 stop:4223 length:432 start_codon:yes stop_codon:yes gene_type:complete
VKKKYTPSPKDKKDWIDFVENIGKVDPKEEDLPSINRKKINIPKLDLHGFTLVEANKVVEKFINNSFTNGYKKILVVTGKGLRSKTQNNPYISEKLNVLRYSIPEFIKNKKDLNSKIINITKADINDGGEGALYIFLKKNKNL